MRSKTCRLALALAATLFVATLPALRAQFTTEDANVGSSFNTLVCGVPTVQGVSVSSDMISATLEVDIPLPSKTASDEMAFAILFGDLSVVNRKLEGSADISMLDLVFDPSASFGSTITDKCQEQYRSAAERNSHLYTDERTDPPITYGMIANSRCLSSMGRRTEAVKWTSTVHDIPDDEYQEESSLGCELGIAKWYLTFNIAEWTSAANVDALSISKKLMNGGTKYTYPFRIYVTATSKTTTLAETYYAPYRFELFQKSTVIAALPVRETQLSGYRAHYLQNFVRIAGDTQLSKMDPLKPDTTYGFNLVKLQFDMVFFKEADATALPTLSVLLNNLRVKVQATRTGSFQVGEGDDGTVCEDIGDQRSSIATSDVTIVEETDSLFEHTIKSKDGTFYKQTLSVVCYLRVYRKSEALFIDSNDRVPLRFEYTHTYVDAKSNTLLTDPVRDPIAIFLQQMNFQAITTFEYKTPLKGVVYKIPQGKIDKVDQGTWTTNDVRSAMINAFANNDAPRAVTSVTVDTPIAGAVTRKNLRDRGRYSIRLITAFLMAAKSSLPQFVEFAPAKHGEAPTEIMDPCGARTKHDNDDIIGFSTLYSDTGSDAYTDRFSRSLKDLLENTDGSNKHVGNEVFQINGRLGTKPFTQNYMLKESEGAQDVLILPFLPKLRLTDTAYNSDDYDTTLCMVLEVDPYQDGVFSSEVSRKLLAVQTRGDDFLDAAEPLNLRIDFIDDFRRANDTASDDDVSNTTTTEGNTTVGEDIVDTEESVVTSTEDGKIVDTVTVTKTDDYTYTNTN
ncbi:hypothetical protein CYMTET_54253 [Cymbomonas tetramitiformis]|uniref:Uncharacterized protein n=1 Tax=Cymbomonas tetramitiformis TaxID=36881 RepID=A0AAE0BFG6_9CHLO|nr:hypothetical protein CYMTET_54253 [Cymbomonas tetramitiformis]